MNSQNLYIPALGGLYSRLKPFILPLLRVFVGVLFILHGYGKFTEAFWGGGLEGLAGGLGKLGFHPGILWAWGAMFIEFFGGIAIVLGLYTRVFAFAAAVMMFLIVFVLKDLGIWFAHEGGIEYELVLALLFSSFAILGAGKYSLDERLKKTF